MTHARSAFWRSTPGRFALAASTADVVVSLILAIATIFMLLIDALKLALYRALLPSTASTSAPR